MITRHIIDAGHDHQDDLDSFVEGFIECALWVGMDQKDTPLEDIYTQGDIEEITIRGIIKECWDFLTEAREYLDQTGHEDYTRHGIDFMLTRNHHGAGYWDRGYPDEIGDKLTELSHSYGSYDLYVGDDGKLYGYP